LGQAPLLELRIAGITETQLDEIRGQVRHWSARAGVSERALLAAAQASGAQLAASRHFDAEALSGTIVEQLEAQADTIKELEARLAALARADDPAVASLIGRARTALDDGHLADSDALLAQAEETDLAAARTAAAQAEARLIRAAATIAERGRIAFLQADHLAAAAHYARATDTVPETAIEQRWSYRMGQARALYERGRLFNEPAPLREAAQLIQGAILLLAPRARYPDNWAAAQTALGNTLGAIGRLGDLRALHDAVIAHRAALEIISRSADPLTWAAIEGNLGIALLDIGEREGNLNSIHEALEALRA
jgi:hypothetical protein